MAPEETRRDRLRAGVASGSPDCTRDLVGLRDERWYEDHDHRVDLVVWKHCSQRTLIGGGGGRRHEVDRVSDAGVWRGEVPQRRLGSRREFWHLEARAGTRVSGKDGRTTAVAHDGDTRSRRRRLMREDLSGIEQPLECV